MTNLNLPKRRNNASAPPPRGFEAMIEGRSADSALTLAQREAVSSYRQMQMSVARVDADKTLTEGGRLVRQAAIARSTIGPALAALETAKARTAEGKAATAKELAKHYDYSGSNFAEIFLASELRSYFSSLNSDARFDAFRQAVNDLDLPTLRAIAAAPAALSGLPEQMRAHGRETLLTLVAPEALARSKQLADDLAFAENFETQLRQAVADSVDFESAAEIEKSAAA